MIGCQHDANVSLIVMQKYSIHFQPQHKSISIFLTLILGQYPSISHYSTPTQLLPKLITQIKCQIYHTYVEGKSMKLSSNSTNTSQLKFSGKKTIVYRILEKFAMVYCMLSFLFKEFSPNNCHFSRQQSFTIKIPNNNFCRTSTMRPVRQTIHYRQLFEKRAF